MKRLLGLALLVLVVLWAPASSFGQNATCQAYNPQTGCIPFTGKVTTAKGTLPFTGADLPVLAGCGLLLIVAGVVSRRLSAPRQ